MITEKEEICYPWLLFQLKNNYFAINSHRVTGIMICPEEMTQLPDSPDFVRGLIMQRDNIVRLLDLRMLFGMEPVSGEREDFHQMLETRKQDHLNWAKELKRCSDNAEHFTLATDPHKCAFGKWLYSYEPISHTVAAHLHKIEEPHKKLHDAAVRADACERDCEHCKREKCLQKVMTDLEDNLVPQIISLLDEAQQVFRDSYREMVIIIENGDRRLGLIVDQVLAVENISRNEVEDAGVNFFHDLTYIDGICQSNAVEGNILVVNDEILLNLTGGDGDFEN